MNILLAWQVGAGQYKEASHQLLPKFQDQVDHFHLRLVLHPSFDVLLGIFPALLTKPPTYPGLVPIPPSAFPHRLTNSFQVQNLQLLGHLFVSLPIPAIKMGGLEKPPVMVRGS